MKIMKKMIQKHSMVQNLKFWTSKTEVIFWFGQINYGLLVWFVAMRECAGHSGFRLDYGL